MLKGLILVLALTPAPAAAQVLWGKVEAGMPASRVQELYPESPDVSHGPDNTLMRMADRIGPCSALVSIEYEGGLVSEVYLKPEDFSVRDGSCVLQAEDLLARRYGKPDSDTEHGTAAEGLRRIRRWTGSGVTVEFIRDAKKSGGPLPCLSIACTLAPPSPYGLSDHWILTYSAKP